MSVEPPDQGAGRKSGWAAWIPLAVLLSMALLMVPGAWTNSATNMEYVELPAGLAQWRWRALGVYRVCGPVSKYVYSLPAYAMGLTVDADLVRGADRSDRVELELGRDFERRHLERYQAIYRSARVLSILVTLLGALLVFEWSTRLFGRRSGIVSLCAWCWAAPILGHGAVVTSDVIAAVAAIVAARTLWGFLLRPTLGRATLAGLALGLAACTKFTLLILYPCWAVILAARLVWPADGPDESRTTSIRAIGLGLVAFVVSITAIDALYLFQGVGVPLSRFETRSSFLSVVEWIRGRSEFAWISRIPSPLPRDFLRGLDVQLRDVERPQTAYLLGRLRTGGWWYWYPAAALIKTPLPLVVLIGMALGRLRRLDWGSAGLRWGALCVLIPAAEAALAVAGATGTGSNAAYRYLIPSLGLLCVWAGVAARGGSPATRVTITVMLIWLGLGAALGVPDHLGWQNEVGRAWNRWSGRPALIGDSLDWGQDLARLGDWTRRRSREGTTLLMLDSACSGAPYGLAPPAARPFSEGDDHAVFVAVSEDVLFSSPPLGSRAVGAAPSSLTAQFLDELQRTTTFERVGRSIRVYRISDLKGK